VTTAICKKIISRNSTKLAFLIGNGINRYYNSSACSWEDLLINLWDKHAFGTQSFVPKGIAFTEFYDALELQGYRDKSFPASLRKDVVNQIRAWAGDDKQNLILNKIRSIDAPIMTLNFDALIPQSMSLKPYQLKHFNSNDFYPWDKYYSDSALESAIEGFGVWYINGMLRHQRSIKLGLSHYMGNVDKARPLIQQVIARGPGKITPKSAFANSWLNILFSKDLFIFGAGLNESEIFLRWMLIQRAKYYRRFPDEKRKGWYVAPLEGTSSSDSGKRFFLQSVGFEVLSVPTYESLYEEIWA
jgi:hypothetical protein